MQVDIAYNLGKYPVDTESREEKCGSKWSLADVRAEETPHNRYNMRPFTPPHIYACPLLGVVSSACINNREGHMVYTTKKWRKVLFLEPFWWVLLVHRGGRSIVLFVHNTMWCYRMNMKWCLVCSATHWIGRRIVWGEMVCDRWAAS